MSATIDLTGKQFGQLMVLAKAQSVSGRAAWVCRCACGCEKVVIGQLLRREAVVSCGCQAKKRAREMGRANKRHGMTNTPEFRTWTALISRCMNPKDYRYKRYGGRGITVCERWLESFENFVKDVGEQPFVGAELDRKNNDGNYEPKNCHWVTSKENNNNRSSNRVINFAGESKTLTEWAEQKQINPATLRVRLEAGWPIEKALNQPVRGKSNA